MTKQFAILLIAICSFFNKADGFDLELNTSYDYFRGPPDGSWNGNNGLLLGANLNSSIYECFGAQIGGSYGLYNWDGRGNVVFSNPKTVQQQGFITAGVYGAFSQIHGALVYDRLFTRHYSIYDVDPSVDQLRYHLGYEFCREEVGVWGTAALTTAHKRALGVPVHFKAINQVSLFWSHLFDNCARTLIWVGIPYGDSLMHRQKSPGTYFAGALFRAPLTDCLYFDGFGSYMGARSEHGVRQSRNYCANISIGITYMFGEGCCCESGPLPIANHSNFLVQTNLNQ